MLVSVIITIVLVLVWLYVLHLLTKSELSFWRFLVGSAGTFIFGMVWIRPFLTHPLAQVVAAISGILGQITGFYSTYFKYGVIFVNTVMGDSMTLVIDFECSGILEILAFLSLLIFFKAYTKREKLIVGSVGTILLILFNALRITIICLMIHYGGTSTYYVAHTFVGRIVFYALSVALYFYVFIRTQVVRQKVGGFKYGHSS